MVERVVDEEAVAGLRVPQQDRSRARVSRVIEAAESILVDEGFSALTIRHVADRAGVPVGTIYQFFADKEALVLALARRYMEEGTAVMERLLAEASERHWPDVVSEVLDAYVALYRGNPAFLVLWESRQLSEAMLRADEANNVELADGLREVLLAQEDLIDNAQLKRSCLVAVQVAESLLALAFSVNRRGDPKIISDAKLLEQLWLDDVIRRCASDPSTSPKRSRGTKAPVR